MPQLRRSLALLLILTLALSLAACRGARRPAPDGEIPVAPGPGAGAPAQSVTAAIFFADWQAQHLIPEPRQIARLEGAPLANQIVQEILAGPTDPYLHRPLPANVRLLEPVTVQNATAYVNLSRELTEVQGTAGAMMALGALTLSLTEVAGVEKVQVLVEGKKSEHFEGMMLEPLGRGLYDFNVLVDPSRTAYLQDRVARGLDVWRLDARQVLQWEGRMFGFTAAELQAAELTVKGHRALAQIARGTASFTVELHLNPAAPKDGIWTVAGISRHDRPVGAAVTVSLYFADWQAQHLIPEARQVAAAQGEELATRVMEALLSGPVDPHLFRTLPDVRLLEPVRIAGSIAAVNLSTEFLRIQGSAGTAMAVGSILLSLTDLPGIEQVQLLVDGSREIEHVHYTLNEPIGRGLSTAIVLIDQERAAYLQKQADAGREVWRRDPARVLQWEGRMFGFTAAELQAAAPGLTVTGEQATAVVSRDGRSYTVELSRHRPLDGIWIIIGAR